MTACPQRSTELTARCSVALVLTRCHRGQTSRLSLSSVSCALCATQHMHSGVKVLSRHRVSVDSVERARLNIVTLFQLFMCFLSFSETIRGESWNVTRGDMRRDKLLLLL